MVYNPGWCGGKRIKEAWTHDPLWESEEVWHEEDLRASLREAPAGTENSRHQDNSCLPPAVLGKKSSCPCSKLPAVTIEELLM